ncbi:MAG: hypothetical protein KJ795_09640 [Gammaproteobacteria bacterium]|nr:hypothetical protein [Gammaproteobacteria bacterium]MBU1776111.1 hypothetical protein [Gammaproteobacteria bacterium]MBU1968031.1 hypothetical protein [Gammaproteobacteria bacterium]
MNHDESEFEQRVRTTLDSSVSGLDAETRSRLSAIRHEAVERGKSKPFLWLGFDFRIPATVLAVCAALAVALLMSPAPREGNELIALEDAEVALELILGEGIQEVPGDPDFYVWVDEILLEQEEPEHAG